MAFINNIQVSQVLYDYHMEKMGNTTMKREGCWEVKVLEIDLVNNKVLCSWNGNQPRWWSEDRIKKLRVKKKNKYRDGD